MIGSIQGLVANRGRSSLVAHQQGVSSVFLSSQWLFPGEVQY